MLKIKQAWFVPVVVVAGVVLALAFGTYQLNVANSKPLHPDLQQIPAAREFEPAPKWAAAAKESRMIARQGLAQQNLPGLSVAVGVGGDIVWSEGFGWANLENHDAVDPSMRFRIGHVSNTLTSAAVGMLREKGRLNLDDEIQEYVPAFPKKPWPVTLRELMGNTAGIHHYKDTEWGDKPTQHCDRASEGLTAFANDPLLFKPDAEYRYSTYGWVLVSAAVEAVAGEPFFDFMRAQVFEPLGMSHTGPDSKASGSDRVTSYFRGNFNNVLTTNVDYSCFAGGGAFFSTPSDLVRFGMALAKGKFLQPDTVKMLQTRQQLTSGVDTNYGLGWMLETVDLAGQPTNVAGHASRTIEGASTSFLMFPEHDIVVAVTSNMSFADMRSIALAIAEKFKAAK